MKPAGMHSSYVPRTGGPKKKHDPYGIDPDGTFKDEHAKPINLNLRNDKFSSNFVPKKGKRAERPVNYPIFTHDPNDIKSKIKQFVDKDKFDRQRSTKERDGLSGDEERENDDGEINYDLSEDEKVPNSDADLYTGIIESAVLPNERQNLQRQNSNQSPAHLADRDDSLNKPKPNRPSPGAQQMPNPLSGKFITVPAFPNQDLPLPAPEKNTRPRTSDEQLGNELFESLQPKYGFDRKEEKPAANQGRYLWEDGEQDEQARERRGERFVGNGKLPSDGRAEFEEEHLIEEGSKHSRGSKKVDNQRESAQQDAGNPKDPQDAQVKARNSEGENNKNPVAISFGPGGSRTDSGRGSKASKLDRPPSEGRAEVPVGSLDKFQPKYKVDSQEERRARKEERLERSERDPLADSRGGRRAEVVPDRPKENKQEKRDPPKEDIYESRGNINRSKTRISEATDDKLFQYSATYDRGNQDANLDSNPHLDFYRRSSPLSPEDLFGVNGESNGQASNNRQSDIFYSKEPPSTTSKKEGVNAYDAATKLLNSKIISHLTHHQSKVSQMSSSSAKREDPIPSTSEKKPFIQIDERTDMSNSDK